MYTCKTKMYAYDIFSNDISSSSGFSVPHIHFMIRIVFTSQWSGENLRWAKHAAMLDTCHKGPIEQLKLNAAVG